jgi:hypothetical protein
MKKICVFVFTLIIGVCFTVTGYCQEKPEATPAKPAVAADTPVTPEKVQTKKTPTKKTTKKKTTKKKKKTAAKKTVEKPAAKPVEKSVEPAKPAEPEEPAKK